jgi:bifunctional UDP-N-acetylglucosamine pyrophosphorylase/glucosamine-1-phosphate N-acetyltransferase
VNGSNAPTVLVMAAGEGTRMHSSVPKALHEVCGRPLVSWPILAAQEAGAGRIVAIVSPQRDISAGLPPGTESVEQPQADGTGGAVRAALDVIRESRTVVVLSADHPVISAESIGDLLEAHSADGAAATVLTAELDEPGSYGRIVRDSDGSLARIVEAKAPGDATPEELAITEVNTGTYVFDAAALAEALEGISNDNAQGEYYLGDVLPLIRASGGGVAAHLADDEGVTLGVNTRLDLARATAVARQRILDAHMLAGVTLVDPAATWIDAAVEIEADVTIEPGTLLRGETRIGGGSVVGPNTTLIGSTLGSDVVATHSYLVDCEVLDGCTIGPFTHIRPQTVMGRGSKAGSFVELKNAQIGEDAKVPHLSYVGDADIGVGTNIGAGSITANYDGFRKHRTVVGEHCRIGVDTMFVAPVSIGDGAYTGAGTVVRKDVPGGALAVPFENKHRHIDGYAERRAKQAEENQDEGS